MRKTYQGKYTPKFPEKYSGDPTNIVFRSSWELKVFKWCDLHSSVVKWGSEEKPIPYRSPIDGKVHRYFPDLLITIKYPSGELVTFLVEIKPKSQTKMPKKRMIRGMPSKKYLTEVQTYAVNQAKAGSMNLLNTALEILKKT
jgi:hypothetical protein